MPRNYDYHDFKGNCSTITITVSVSRLWCFEDSLDGTNSFPGSLGRGKKRNSGNEVVDGIVHFTGRPVKVVCD